MVKLNFKQFISYIDEENTSGDIGTDKLTQTRKKITPGEPSVTPEPLSDFETIEPIRVS